MDPTFVQNFRDYIDLSTSDLQTTLNAIIMHETLQYDVIYEKFLKAIENYKISMLNQMKSQLFPGDLATERQKEHIMLQQMKNLVTIKIKTAIETLNNETDALARQRLLEQISLFNDSLQKIESNLISFEHENIRRGSVTSRSEFSMILQGLHHTDEVKEMIGASQMTPITRKLSPHQLDSSAVSKFGLTDLQSKMHPRLPAFESKTEPHNIPKLNLEGENLKQEEIQQESEKLSLTVPKDSQGMSLFEMFDACLNNITNNNGERHKRALLGFDRKEKISKTEIKEEIVTTPIPVSIEPKTEEMDIDDIPENQIEEEQLQKSIEEIVENVIGTPEEEDTSDTKARALSFMFKLDKFIIRRCLTKWKQVPSVFRPPKSDEEFDLLHGNIDSIGGMESFDTDKFVEDPVGKRILTPIQNKEDITYDYETNNILSAKMNFYDNSCPEPEQLSQFIREQQRLRELENENKQKPMMKTGTMLDASPSKLGAKNFKKPMLAKSPLKASQEKDKLKEKPKDRNTNITKSPRIATTTKKEADKPDKLKLEAKSSSSKGIIVKSPAVAGKSTMSKVGLPPPSNKENTFANRASPTNRKSLVGNAK